MEPPIEFINLQECMEIFGFTERQAIRLTNIKGCPMLPRKKGQQYQINRAKFAEWLNNMTK